MNSIEKNGGKIAAALCIASCIPAVASVYAVATADGWHGDKYLENRQVAKGWKNIDGEMYYFDEKDGSVNLEETQKAVADAALPQTEQTEEQPVAAQEEAEDAQGETGPAEESEKTEEASVAETEDEKTKPETTPAEEEKTESAENSVNNNIAMVQPAEEGAGTAGGAEYSPQPGLGENTQQTPVQEEAPVQQTFSVPGFIQSTDAWGNPVTIDQYGNTVQYEADGRPVTYDAQGTPYYYDSYGNPWPNGIAPDQPAVTPAPEQTVTPEQTPAEETPAPEQTPSAPAEEAVQTPSWNIPGFVTTTEGGLSITTDQYGNIVEMDENGQAVTYDANGIPYYYDAYGNPWPYGDPGLLDQYQPSADTTVQPDQDTASSWTPEVTEPEVFAPDYTVPGTEEVTDPYAAYAELNQAIVQAALPLVGTTNGWQCTEVAAAALAGAGVYDADSYWPDEFADVYGVYVDNPQAGNLIYYDNGGRGVDHIAVYIGDGQAVHGNYYIDGESYTVIAGAELEHAGTPQYIQVLR